MQNGVMFCPIFVDFLLFLSTSWALLDPRFVTTYVCKLELSVYNDIISASFILVLSHFNVAIWYNSNSAKKFVTLSFTEALPRCQFCAGKVQELPASEPEWPQTQGKQRRGQSGPQDPSHWSSVLAPLSSQGRDRGSWLWGEDGDPGGQGTRGYCCRWSALFMTLAVWDRESVWPSDRNLPRNKRVWLSMISVFTESNSLRVCMTQW